ncbi:Carboxypeptidase regulatory-like domain-containing protein [Cryobacterium flavum]|uniref:alpha-amylase n=1 Tax=Cryobacterium flavum TaxID=1424659 RepID=A0A4R8V3C4_9MICO|nr:fibronectin type III domain-containing protein [Cryobacterium flavum]TFB77143.1 hypothetical protein E3O21_09620 [Cryobacterium flavum]SDN38171.1 Carboxypeptidase regulatory-like domain-containing protein [Cryobacterium flavum]
MAKHLSIRGARSRAVAVSTSIALLFGLGFAAVGSASATEAPADTIVVAEPTPEPSATDAPAPAPATTDTPAPEAPESVEPRSEPSTAPSAEPIAEPSTQPSTEPSAETTEEATEAPNPAARAADEHAAPADGTAAIYGRLIDSVTKEPLVGFSVELARYNGETDALSRQKGTTDDAGAFAFIVTEATWYGVEASNDARGYVRAYSDDIDAVLGENFDVADIEIVRGAIISGTLTPPAGLASGFTTSISAVPVSGNTGYGYASVELTPGTPTQWHLAVLPGTYNVQFSGAYNATNALWWNSAGNVATQGASQSITVAVGDTVPGVDATLSYSDRLIRGTVVDDQGLPLVNVSVQARPASGSGNYTYGYTDDQGEYVIGNLAGGNYILQFIPRPGDGMSEFYDDAATSDLATPLAFVAGTARTYDNIDATIAPGYSISGTVQMPSIPNTYVSVVAESADGTVSDSSSWNSADSSYIIQNLAPGEYTLKFTVGSVVQYYGGDTKAEATVLTVPNVETADLVGIDVTIAVAVISGTIATAAGSYPQVEILSLDGAEVVATGYTGSGTYSVAVNPGSYMARVVENNTIGQYYNGVFTLEEATPIVVADGDIFAADFGLVGGTISGTVTADASVSGAVATLYRANNTLNSIRTVTLDDSGAYTFDGLTPDNYVIKVASGSTLLTERWFGPSGKKADATAIDLKANADHSSADIVLTEGGGLRGTITGLTTSSSANIYLYSPDNSWVTSAYAYSSDGSDARAWSLAGVPAGEYKVQLSSSGTTEWWKNATSLETATLITVTAGEWVENVDFAQSVSISGTVTSAVDGSAVANGSVYAYRAKESYSSYHAYSGSDGSYVFTDLPDGDYKLKFDGYSNAKPLSTQWYTNAADLDSATAITVVDGVPATNVDAALQPGIAISGTVTDAATGAPIANASISGWSNYSIVTDANGHYSSTVAAAGRYQFRVQSSTHVNPADVAFDVPAEGLPNADAQLVAGTVISGTVTAANNGVPLSNVTVFISSTSDNWWSYNSAYTDYSGNFTSQPLLPGSYYLRYENSQGQYVTQWFDNAASGAQSTAVNVGIDPVTSVDAQLTLGGAIVGTITGSDGQPIANARVGLATAPSQPAARTAGARVAGGELLGIETYTGSDGSYRLPTVEPGRYVLFVYENDHKTSWYNGQSTLDKATVIVVEAGENIEVDAAVEPLAENETALQPEQTLSTVFAVTQQPTDQSIESGNTANFTAFASGDPLPTVQWQTDASGEWADLFWQTSTTLNVTAPAASDAPVNYRAVFTQDGDTRTTESASLTALAPITAPDAPALPTLTNETYAGGTVSWAAPASNGADITGYTVKVYENLTLVRSIPTGVVLTSPIGGLANGTDYEVTVTANNSQGAGAESERATLSTVAFTVPNAPVAPTLVAVDSTQVTATWVAPTEDGGTPVTNYLVSLYQGDALVSTKTTDARTLTFTGLTRATAYTAGVVATNAIGSSAVSDRSAAVSTPATSPGAPTALNIGATSRSQIAVTWSAPEDDGGKSITGYTLKLYQGTELVNTEETDGQGFTFTGLTRATAYTFDVSATNSVGTGPGSERSTVATTLATVPDAAAAPTLVQASVSALDVTWTAPNNGGSALTGYTVRLFDGSTPVATKTTEATTVSFTGLTRGIAYTADVTAANTIGSGDASAKSKARTIPLAVPGVPDAPTLTALSATEIAMAWTTPVDDGGSAITGYRVNLYQGSALVSFQKTDADTLTFAFTGLTRATAYTAEVVALNAIGGQEASERSAAASTAATVPGLPTALKLAANSATEMTATWSAPADNGGLALTAYSVSVYQGSELIAEQTTDAATTTATFADLDAATDYTATVRATNAVGTSAHSADSGIVRTLPTDPIEADLTEDSKDEIVPSSIDLIQGESVTVSGLTPGEQYFAFFMSTPVPTSWQTASSTGTITVRVPTTLLKAHRIVVTNAAGVVVGWANVTISPVPQPAGTPGAPAGTGASTASEKKALAGTGTDPLPFTLLAGLVFALGAALLVAGRRRGRAGLVR